MLWARVAWTRLVGLLRRGAVERDMDEELRFHVAMRERELVAGGASEEEARREALRAFGNVEALKDECRDVRGGGMFETILKDARYAARRARKSPVFTAVAVLSLALGVGANTAIFTLVNAVLLRPLAVDRPEQLVSVFPVAKDDSVSTFSYPNYLDVRDRNDVFSGFYVTRFAPVGLGTNGASERVWGFEVSANYFDVLGVRAALGRTLEPDDDRAALASPVVVLSDGCWRRRFAADPSVVGREVEVNGRTFTIVGVAPEGFRGTEIAFSPELYFPVTMQQWLEPGSSWLDDRDTQNVFAGGRLKPGVSVAAATASLDALMAELGREYPAQNAGRTIRITPPGLIHPIFRDAIVGFSGALMSVVALVLAIACANVANLLLGRSAERRREIAVRLALGASRARLVRQLLTESVLLALAGGGLGLGLATVVVRLVAALQPPLDFPFAIDMPVDARVFGFSLAASALTGLAFGLAPALQSTKPDVVPELKSSGSRGATSGRGLLRGALVVAQVALSVVTLVSGGLVLRTLANLQSMNPGFDPRGVAMLGVDLGMRGYDDERARAFFPLLLDRVRALPGVRAASFTSNVPLAVDYSATSVYREGDAPVYGADVPEAMVSTVDAAYFETMRIPLLAGRAFDARDRRGEARAIVVNEAFVRRFFPNATTLDDAIGRRVSHVAPDGPFSTIVGVARDGKYFSAAESPRPFVYFPASQSDVRSAYLLVRGDGPGGATLAAVRAEVARLDPTLAVYSAKSLDDHLSAALFPARVAATLLGAFGLLALALAAIGIYGVVAVSVSQRTREIGVRMALGARPRDVLAMVVRHGLLLNAIGVAVGVAAALAVTRVLSSLLYDVSPTDAATFAGVALVLTAVVCAACAVPAWRAARVDPTRALRSE